MAGQSGADTRGDTEEGQQNKVYYTPWSQRDRVTTYNERAIWGEHPGDRLNQAVGKLREQVSLLGAREQKARGNLTDAFECHRSQSEDVKKGNLWQGPASSCWCTWSRGRVCEEVKAAGKQQVGKLTIHR